jgi:MFS family permease
MKKKKQQMIRWLMLLRVGLGIGEGVCFPSIHVIVSNWLPDAQKARAVAIITAGAYMGNMAALLISQPLISSPQFGWRYAFYLFGSAGFVWNAVRLFFFF